MANRETLGLVRAFYKIEDADVRQRVSQLPEVIDMVIEAVSAGELDKVLRAALGERRVKLRQVS